jgi:multidrug efflux pump subunit AcrA (membrane-fusion protein)
VNPNTGTTLMQIIVDNSAGELMPGDYAGIRLQAAAVAHVLSVPSSAVIFDAKGVSIATVGNDNRVLLKSVTIGRDLGQIVEISSGLAPNDQVIQNPPDGIANTDLVHVIGPGASAVAAAPPPSKNDHG